MTSSQTATPQVMMNCKVRGQKKFVSTLPLHLNWLFLLISFETYFVVNCCILIQISLKVVPKCPIESQH